VRSLVCVAVALALAAPLPAAAIPAVEVSFAVRTRDTHLGSGRLTIAARPKAAKAPRQVNLTGKTEALLGVVYAGSLDATSWLDGAGLPVAARWRSELGGKKAMTRARFDGGRVQAQFDRPGQPPFAVDRQVDEVLIDPVAFMPWLMQRKPTPGKKIPLYLYTGMDVCFAELAVGALETVVVDGQARDALPISAELQACRIQRRFTIWVAPKDITPLKMSIHDRLFGTIDFLLQGVRKVELAQAGPDDAPAGPASAGGDKRIR